jgi:cytochrome c oxidase cbb3-type subunit 4
MDINLVRSLVTLSAFASFLGIVWWAFSPSRKARFEHDARMLLEEPDAPVNPGSGESE